MAANPADSSQDDIWINSVAQYKKDTGHVADVEAKILKLKTFEDLLDFIESRGKAFKEFRSTHEKLCTRLKQCLTPIATLSQVGSSAVGSTTFAIPAGAILGSVAYLIMASQEVSKAYDWIQNIFAELEEFTQRLPSYTSSPINDVLRRKVVATLAFLLRIIGRSEVLIKRGRFLMYLRVTFLGKDEETRGLVEELNRHISNEQRMVVALTYEQTNQNAAQGTRIEDKVSQISDEVKEIQQRQIDQNTLMSMEKTLRTTAVSDTDDWYSLNKKTLLRGSGAWLQKEALFDAWLQQSAVVLWIFGGPGSGKTMLSTWLIQFLLKTYAEHSDGAEETSIGYFYIREDSESLRNPNQMLKTMAWQLQQTDSAFRHHAASACQISRNTARAEDTWENIFLNFYHCPVANNRRAILVIDGLDEAEFETRHRLLTLFKDYVMGIPRGQRHRIQFAILGRTTLRSDLYSIKFEREEKIIHVSSRKNQEDLSNYILDRVQNLAVVHEMKTKKGVNRDRAKKFTRAVQKRVLEGADGVFLWAQLILDQMKGKDEGDIRRLLATPPGNLDDMIYSVLKRLSQDPELDPGTTAKILTWVSFSRRPLRFGEIDVIARLDSRTTNWMLWANMRGKFASVFRFRYPKGYDPDAVPEEQSDDVVVSTEIQDEPRRVTSDVIQSPTSDDSDSYSLSEKSDDLSDLEPEITGDPKGNTTETDAEADDHYDWYQKNTIVEFTHARFRDIVKIEGNSDTRHRESLPILLNIHRADILIVIDCLKMMREGHSKGYDKSHYLSYPTFNLFAHLENIEEQYLEPDERSLLTEELYWLLHEEEGCRSLFAGLGERDGSECDDFWRIFFHRTETFKQIQHWLKQVCTRSVQNTAKAAWIEAAAGSPRVLLEPLAMTAAKIWLTKSGYDDDSYQDKSEFQVWFLKAYMTLDMNGSVPNEIAHFIWERDGNFWDLDAEEIEVLAEWAGLEKTTHWYTAVGWILWEANEVDRALTMLTKAIELDSDAWVAMECKARCLADFRAEYLDAIDWIKKAVEVMPQNLKDNGLDSWLLGYCSTWLKELGDHEAALDMAKSAWEENTGSFPAIYSYVTGLGDAEQWSTLIDVLRYIDDIITSYGHSILVQFFTRYELHQTIGPACRKGGFPEFILRAMSECLELTSQKGHEAATIWELCAAATFRYEWYDQDDEPVKLLEEALEGWKNLDAAAQRSNRGWVTERIYKLAQIYFDSAVAHHHSGGDATKAARKLENLATVVGADFADDEEAFKYYSSGYPALLWGRWLRDYAKSDDATWKKCFRARLLEQLNGLDDDDPTNDTAACKGLAISLFQAGDEQNAASIVATLFKTLESHVRDKQRSQPKDLHETTEISQRSEDQEHSLEDVTTSAAQTWEIVDRPDQALTAKSPPSEADTPAIPAKIAHESSQTNRDQHRVASTLSASAEPLPRAPSVLKLHLKEDLWTFYRCHGCRRDAEEANSMWFCEICHDTNFCTECLQNVKSRTQERRQCNPAHKWHQAWPIPEGRFEDMAKNYEQGDVALRKDWLDSLRTEWLIEQIVSD